MRQLQGYYAEPGDAQLGYTVPNLLIEYVMRNTHVPVGPWRGVNTNQNAVYMECFMDEVAKAAGKDPLAFRRALMEKYPKHLACSTPRPRRATGASRCRRRASRHRAVHGLRQLFRRRRRGLGERQGQAQGASPGAGARTAAMPSIRARSRRRSQGSVAYGLSATLYGEMPVEKGRMTNLNFDSYEIMRLAEFPKVETVIVPTYDFWGGVGEPTICVRRRRCSTRSMRRPASRCAACR
jgi:isoquinoline 1-oxidoreductase beta subunit